MPHLGALAGLPIRGMAGDQQAALFGQGCFAAGQLKNTYGTGCFTLLNTGSRPVTSQNGLLTCIGWGLGGQTTYVLEGSVFNAGSSIQWLRDELGIIRQASQCDQLAEEVPDNGGVYFVSAFTGLGAPHWDMYARGTVMGLTRGTTKAHLCRAVLEGIAYQTADLIAAMERDAGEKICLPAGGRRRQRQRLHDAVPGRPAGGSRGAAEGGGDHRLGGRLPGRPGRGAVAEPPGDHPRPGAGQGLHPRRRPQPGVRPVAPGPGAGQSLGGGMNPMTALERFLKYIRYDTQSVEESQSTPSSDKQRLLGSYLAQELRELGLENAHLAENGAVYAWLPATPGREDLPVIALLAHMDTAPRVPGGPVKARLVPYTGGEIVLNQEKGIVMTPEEFPDLLDQVGQTLVVTDGTTLLGADDKAGIAEIFSAVEVFVPEPPAAPRPGGPVRHPRRGGGPGGRPRGPEKAAGRTLAYTVDGGLLGDPGV